MHRASRIVPTIASSRHHRASQCSDIGVTVASVLDSLCLERMRQLLRGEVRDRHHQPVRHVYKSPGVVAKGSRSDITKDSTVRAHVYMNSVYFGNRQFGVSLTCEAVLVYKAADEAQGVSLFGDYMMEE